MTDIKSGTSLYVFRKDLRLSDNLALNEALKHESCVLAFIFDPEDPAGEAGLLWLHHSLQSLSNSLAQKALRLVIRKGEFAGEFLKLVKESASSAVYMNRHSSPFIRRKEKMIAEALDKTSVKAEIYESSFLHRFEDVLNGSQTPYKVFTPYYNTVLKLTKRAPLEFARHHARGVDLPSLEIDDLGLNSSKKWANNLLTYWQIGEASAREKLRKFSSFAAMYGEKRDFPALESGTSKLSPHLAFGEISPIQIFYALKDSKVTVAPWLRQLVWRDFSHYLLWHFPHTETGPLRPEFSDFPHKPNAVWLKAWQKGNTGYPIVDAGMRELWATGWMHNRVRMIVASFLVKDMHEPYTAGESWFRHTLVDFDEANNIFGWQWTAGCGADAQPYFRIFNPMSQGEKFDSDASYVKKWIPVLKDLDAIKIHSMEFKKPGLYPEPILEHNTERNVSLEFLEQMKSKSSSTGSSQGSSQKGGKVGRGSNSKTK